jgi:hypothetical protein
MFVEVIGARVIKSCLIFNTAKNKLAQKDQIFEVYDSILVAYYFCIMTFALVKNDGSFSSNLLEFDKILIVLEVILRV